ncbi:hypothetical protein OIDMADRAFT_139014 [Oidiodendron maius Zn]|uniref:Major facilitator superfamily (MFS) profile domain-containing protein n=1 Tax=Oidiodendron maius (strain Zn) TaxID=913774 RepID=A0A0C3C1T9_OIDMZ|nr:hypothetical protein OIDMADRAFT_139014 [Oidiodendron maius Zn]
MAKQNESIADGVATHYEDVEKVDHSIQPSKDIGAQFLARAASTQFTVEDENRVIRLIDRVLLPIMFISFGLQYMDKVLLNGASQFGIVQDLGLYDIVVIDKAPRLSLNKFSNVTLIFYWGYFVGSFPAVYLAQRLPTGKFSAIAIMIWGAVTMTTASVKTYAGFMVQRFFLGVCEAAISPAFSLITAMWYKPTEQPLRIAVWYASTGLGGLVGSIATWGIGHIAGALHPWQYQFIILGAITVAWGFVVLYLLPDNPVQARFLSQMQRTIAVERMRRGQTGIENTHFKSYQVKEALLDPKTWLLVVMTLSIQMVNGAVSGFGAIIVSSFGFNGLHSVLLTGGLGGIVFVLLLGFGLWAIYVPNQRTYIIMFACIPTIAACIIMWKSSWATYHTPLAGFYLLGFFSIIYVMILAVMSANTAGHTKKAFTAGLVWAAYCAGNGIAPLLVKTTETTEHYPTLFKALLVFVSTTLVLTLTLRVLLENKNKSRDRNGLVVEDDAARTGFEDLTDGENPNFRYSW